MIAGIFHEGSGLGNQLFRYVATRVLALDRDTRFSMLNPELFKGTSFMSLDMGKDYNYTAGTRDRFNEKCVRDENGVDIRSYDPEVNFISNNCLIDGEFQDERYFEHRLKEIDEWLKVEPIDMPDDVCVIGFRGGEYKGVPDLFLPSSYFDEAMKEMLKINPKMKFEVHTDDPDYAKSLFNLLVIHDIGINWRAMRYAKYAIIANSSFYILPRLLNGGITIAPHYWARHNIGVWALPQNYYKKFTYI